MLLMLFYVYAAKGLAGEMHDRIINNQRYQRGFLDAVNRLPAEKAIVFVRYGPEHNPHLSLINNDPDLPSARRWFVYDRGPDNLRLMRTAPDRAAFLFDDANHSLHPFVPARDTVADPGPAR